MILYYLLEAGVFSGLFYGVPKLVQKFSVQQANRSIARAQQKESPPPIPKPEPEPEPETAYRMVERYDPYNGRQRFTAQYKRQGQNKWTDIDYWWDKSLTLETIADHKKAEKRRIENEIRSKEPPIIHEIP